MTDKVQKIRNEVERLRNELIQEREKGYGSDTDDACILELQNVLTYIDSLQEESVSEDLEQKALSLFPVVMADKPFTELDLNEEKRRIYKAGAKWQKKQDQETIEVAEDHAMLAGMEKMKEQLMAKAIDAKCFGFQDAALFSFRLPADKYLVGSEVKVIVIKED